VREESQSKKKRGASCSEKRKDLRRTPENDKEGHFTWSDGKRGEKNRDEVNKTG